MKENNLHKDNQNEEYTMSSHVRTVIAVFLGALAAILTGDTALFCGYIIPAVLFYTAFLICIIWIVRELYRQDRIEYKNYCRVRSAISAMEAEMDKLQTNIDLKEDKQVFTGKPVQGNVRPGSRINPEFAKILNAKSDTV